MHRNLPVGTHKAVGRVFKVQPFCPVHQMFTQRTYQSGGGISLAHIAQYDDGLGGFGKRKPVPIPRHPSFSVSLSLFHTIQNTALHISQIFTDRCIKPSHVAQACQIEVIQPIGTSVRMDFMLAQAFLVPDNFFVCLAHQINHHLLHVHILRQEAVCLYARPAPEQQASHTLCQPCVAGHPLEPTERTITALQLAQSLGKPATQVSLTVGIKQLLQSRQPLRLHLGISHPRCFFQHDAGQVFPTRQGTFEFFTRLALPKFHRRFHLRIPCGQCRGKRGSIIGRTQ